MTSDQINELVVDYEIVKSENNLMRQLNTTDGFYRYYLEQLPDHQGKTAREVFEIVNDLYKKVFQVTEGRYTTYSSFYCAIISYRRIRKNRKLS